MARYSESLRDRPFTDYNEYMEYVFDCVNTCLDKYLEYVKTVYAADEGGYKNVLYPDLEVASDACKMKIEKFYSDESDGESSYSFDTGEDGEEEGSSADISEEEEDDEDDELLSLLAGFSSDNGGSESESSGSSSSGSGMASYSEADKLPVSEKLDFINSRAEITVENGISLPFYELCRKLKFENFTTFCFAAGILASTQTDYSSVFQLINENMNLSSPTVEAAAKVYYGSKFSITGAYGDMSVCLEQLLPVLSLNVPGNMPFSTAVSPDKRVIDCLFGRNPNKLDEN